MQKVLTMTTNGCDLRSEAIGWGVEDGDNVVWSTPKYPDAPVGLTPGVYEKSYRMTNPKTPLHALAVGWKLLAPPNPILRNDGSSYMQDDEKVYWDWWFVRDSWD